MVPVVRFSLLGFGNISPWLQGLFGGAGATLLWELGLKPGRERRALARALGAEVGLNLQYIAGARAVLDRQPRSIPADFKVPTLTFTAVAPVIGQLDAVLVADLTALYAEFFALNDVVEMWNGALTEHRKLSGEDVGPRKRSEQQLNKMLVVYRTSLDRTVGRANDALPKLRSASRHWFMRWKKGKTIPAGVFDQRADELIERLQAGLQAYE